MPDTMVGTQLFSLKETKHGKPWRSGMEGHRLGLKASCAHSMPDPGRYTSPTLVPYKSQWAHEVGPFTHDRMSARGKGTRRDL